MSLPDDFVAAAKEFAQVDVVLVASDFDGVLAPLVQDPMASRPLGGTIESLSLLAAMPRTHAAVVSGRDLATLTTLTGLGGAADVTRIGSHGGESSAKSDSRLSPEQRGSLEAVTRHLDAVVAGHRGARLEHKPAAVVLHTRGMPGPAARAAEEAAAEMAARHQGVHVLRGKHVVEMSVVRADKGTALMGMRDDIGAQAVAYFGDDVTDEDVFRLLGGADLGVKVGPGDSAARWRLEGPDDVAEALATLVELRTAAD